MSYKKAILDELYVEFTFDGNISIDVFKYIEELRSIGFANIEFPDQITSEVGIAIGQNLGFIKCWNESKSKLFQLSSKKIVINAVGNYAGWDDFQNFYEQSLQLFKKFETINKISSVSFNTIDRLQINDVTQFSRFFACDGVYIPKWFEEVNYPFDIRLGMGIPGKDPYNKQILITGRIQPANFLIELEIKLSYEVSETMALVGLINKLYSESKKLFESVITQNLRELMNQ